MHKILLAIDSFKGCLTSAEANRAAARGAAAVLPGAEVVQLAVSDGGEGFLQAFRAAVGGELVGVQVCDPLLRPVHARYLLERDTAVVEVAQAVGLQLIPPAERNPLAASSYGVGQMVADAVRRGAAHIIVGLGGSATSDAGRGMLRALEDAFAVARRPSVPAECFCTGVPALRRVRFTIASDVTNPLCGPQGAARVFAPQKGATPAQVAELDARARRFAAASAAFLGHDCSALPGAGAAGGLGYAFMQYLGAQCRPGVELLLQAAHYSDLLRHASLVITGEGAADRQTLMGKLPLGILRRSAPVPVCLLAGRVSDAAELRRAGFARVECINPPGLALSEAMRPEVASRNLCAAAGRLLREFFAAAPAATLKGSPANP